MKTALTNKQVLEITTPVKQAGGLMYFVAALRSIRNYDLQKAVFHNRELLEAEEKAIITALETTYGSPIKWDSPEVQAVLEQPCTVILATIPITDEQIRSYAPNYDTLYCIELIRQ